MLVSESFQLHVSSVIGSQMVRTTANRRAALRTGALLLAWSASGVSCWTRLILTMACPHYDRSAAVLLLTLHARLTSPIVKE